MKMPAPQAPHPAARTDDLSLIEDPRYSPLPEYRLPEANPKPAIVAGLALLAVLVFGFGSWAALAPIASAVVANGEVVVKGNPKVVQHLEGGIVASILVEEGDYVSEDAPLIILETTRAQAETKMLESRLDSLLAQEARLEAEIANAEEISFPESLAERRNDPGVSEVMADQEANFASRQSARAGKIDIYRQRITQLEEQIRALAAARDSAAKQIDIYDDELAGLRELMEKGYYPRNRVRERERDVARLQGEVDSKKAEIARARESIGEARLLIIQLDQDFREQVSSELAETRDQIRDIQERLTVAWDTLSRNTIRAPIAGVVQEMQVYTEGAVLRPGEELMKIVPADYNLIISSEVSPTDIDNVTVGQSADVRLPAFKARITPVLSGEVVTVSADRIEDPERNRAFFKVNIRIRTEELQKLEGRELRPGMPAQVFINTGERTFMRYLLKPLTDAMAGAFKED